MPVEILGRVAKHLPLPTPLTPPLEASATPVLSGDHLAMARAVPGFDALSKAYNAGMRERIVSNLALDYILHGGDEIAASTRVALATTRALDLQFPNVHPLHGAMFFELSGEAVQRLNALLACTQQLQHLTLANCWLGNPQGEKLCLTPLEKLHGLHIENFAIHPAADGLCFTLPEPQSLRTLTLTRGKLTEESLRGMDLGQYTKLQILRIEFAHIAGNLIAALEGVCFENLRGLYLAGNSLGTLVRELPWKRLAKLQELDLSRTSLGPDGGRALQLHLLPNLRILRIADNHLGHSATFLTATASRKFEAIDVGGNQLMDEGAAALGLGRFAGLKHLDVSRNGLGLRGLRSLQLAAFDHLTTLDLSRNPIDNGTLEALPWHRFTQLEELHLAGLYQSAGNSALAARSTVNCAHMHKLRVLNLSGNLFYNGGALEALLRSLPSLESLSLRTCYLRTETLRAINLGKFPALRVLDVSGNSLGDQGIRALGLEEMMQLEQLSLSRCDLDATALDALKFGRPQVLRSLDLAANSFGSLVSCVAALNDKGFTALESLNLSDTQLTGEALLAIRWRNMPSLRRLSLSHNRLRVEHLKALDYAELPLLRHLCLDLTWTLPTAVNNEFALWLRQKYRGIRVDAL